MSKATGVKFPYPYRGRVRIVVPPKGQGDLANLAKAAAESTCGMLANELPEIMERAQGENTEMVRMDLKVYPGDPGLPDPGAGLLKIVPPRQEAGEAEAPMDHGQAMALVNALYQELEFGEEIAFPANFPFLNALKVAFPNLPHGGYTIWQGHMKKIPQHRSHEKRIEARKLLGKMIERWGKAIQDCVEGPEKES